MIVRLTEQVDFIWKFSNYTIQYVYYDLNVTIYFIIKENVILMFVFLYRKADNNWVSEQVAFLFRYIKTFNSKLTDYRT